jgi:hypothetical protein
MLTQTTTKEYVRTGGVVQWYSKPGALSSNPNTARKRKRRGRRRTKKEDSVIKVREDLGNISYVWTQKD